MSLVSFRGIVRTAYSRRRASQSLDDGWVRGFGPCSSLCAWIRVLFLRPSGSLLERDSNWPGLGVLRSNPHLRIELFASLPKSFDFVLAGVKDPKEPRAMTLATLGCLAASHGVRAAQHLALSHVRDYRRYKLL